jgi:hypothetical protein
MFNKVISSLNINIYAFHQESKKALQTNFFYQLLEPVNGSVGLRFSSELRPQVYGKAKNFSLKRAGRTHSTPSIFKDSNLDYHDKRLLIAPRQNGGMYYGFH